MRRVGDSNPRSGLPWKTVFETAAFDRSANSPFICGHVCISLFYPSLLNDYQLLKIITVVFYQLSGNLPAGCFYIHRACFC